MFWQTKKTTAPQADVSAARPKGPPRPSQASYSTEQVEAPDTFSVLDLRDRVVIMLLFDQIVTEKQVADAWAEHQQEATSGTREPLWRLLTLVPEIDRRLVFEEAARVYGIEKAHIHRRVALPLIEQTERRLPSGLWDRMVRHRLLPVAQGTQNHSQRRTIILASHDPTHPEIEALLPRLDLTSYELRYAPEIELVTLLADAFPWKYTMLKETLEQEEQAFVDHHPAAASPSETEPDTHAQEAGDGTLNTSSIIAFFEDLLVRTVRHGTAGVCLAAGEGGRTEVFVLNDDTLESWMSVDHIAFTALMATMRGAIIRKDFSILEQDRGEILKRWIDGNLVHFRLTALPTADLLDHESILIRVLR